MELWSTLLKNLLQLPLLCFGGGFLSACSVRVVCENAWGAAGLKFKSILTIAILFLIGMKGGGAFLHHFDQNAFWVMLSLLLWGVTVPFISYYLLKTFSQIDHYTACALSASFGSISVMTFVAGTTFLEALGVGFDKMMIGSLAFMELPGIISGIVLARMEPGAEAWNGQQGARALGLNRVISVCALDKRSLVEAVLNKSVFSILCGFSVGLWIEFMLGEGSARPFLWLLQPLLCVFLFDMGREVGRHRNQLKQLSVSLVCLGILLPLLGSIFGLVVTYGLGLAAGTGTLLMVLAASASYIAVPAAMRIAVPQARESIYLPMTLGITFPFNVVLGIPLYYYLASNFV